MAATVPLPPRRDEAPTLRADEGRALGSVMLLRRPLFRLSGNLTMSDKSRCLISISAAAALAVVLAGCQRAAEEKKVSPPAAWALDESKLQQPIRFAAADLDASQSACTDLSAYVNGKWLEHNAIPADESGWGAFLVLRNRSLGVRQQLAERIAAEPNATGIDKIIGDFWATGMDDTKLN